MAALRDEDMDSEVVSKEIAEIERNVEIMGSARFLDVFTMGPTRLFHRTVLAAAGQLFQQMCGVNAMHFYLSTIFQQYIGFTAKNSAILAASVYTFQMVCSPIGVLTVDRYG